MEVTNNFSDLTEISEIKKCEENEENSQSIVGLLEKTRMEGSFLRLLDRPQDIQNKLQNRENRRKSEIDRVRKIFPSGFFAN